MANEQSIRSRLVESNSGPWFNAAAKRLERYVASKGGVISVKELGGAGPGFQDLTVGLADIQGFLAAAGTRRERRQGDWIVSADLDESEAMGRIGSRLKQGSGQPARTVATLRAQPIPPKADRKPKPESPAKAVTSREAAASRAASRAAARKSAADSDKIAEKASTDRSRGRVGWREANLRQGSNRRAQRKSAATKAVRGVVSEAIAARPPSPKEVVRIPIDDSKLSWKAGMSREQQLLRLLSIRPMFGPELLDAMGTSRQNVNFLARRLVENGKIAVLPTSVTGVTRPICYRIAGMPVAQARTLLRQAKPN